MGDTRRLANAPPPARPTTDEHLNLEGICRTFISRIDALLHAEGGRLPHRTRTALLEKENAQSIAALVYFCYIYSMHRFPEPPS